MSIKKKVLSSSVSIVALGEPFFSNDDCIVGIPVARPSVRSNSFKKSPKRLFLYLRERSERASQIALALIERSAFASARRCRHRA